MAKQFQIGDAVVYISEDGMSHTAVLTGIRRDSRVDLNYTHQAEESRVGYHDRRVVNLHDVPIQNGLGHFGAWRAA